MGGEIPPESTAKLRPPPFDLVKEKPGRVCAPEIFLELPPDAPQRKNEGRSLNNRKQKNKTDSSKPTVGMLHNASMTTASVSRGPMLASVAQAMNSIEFAMEY